jgi:hypothetical protein
MKKAKLVFTAVAVVAIAGGVVAARHKNIGTYYSCTTVSPFKCTVTHNMIAFNEYQTTSDPSHPNEVDDAALSFNADCSPTPHTCGTLYYGSGD